jgi:hypothetical protein
MKFLKEVPFFWSDVRDLPIFMTCPSLDPDPVTPGRSGDREGSAGMSGKIGSFWTFHGKIREQIIIGEYSMIIIECSDDAGRL